jgi:hypothetical protein
VDKSLDPHVLSRKLARRMGNAGNLCFQRQYAQRQDEIRQDMKLLDGTDGRTDHAAQIFAF